MAVFPHQANSAMKYLAGGLTGRGLKQRLQFLGVAYLSRIGEVADGKGTLISPSLAGALDFLFELGLPNYIAGSVYQIVQCTNSLKGFQPGDSLGISSRG